MGDAGGGVSKEKQPLKLLKRVFPVRSGASRDKSKSVTHGTIKGQELDPNARSSSTKAITQVPQQAVPPSGITNPAPHDVDGTTILERALERLKEDERAVLKQNTSHSAKDIRVAVQAALDAVTRKQKEFKAKQWSFTFRGQTVVLRNEADKIARWLDRFKAAGDIVANVDPVHVGLPWAGVRMLLEVFNKFAWFFANPRLSDQA